MRKKLKYGLILLVLLGCVSCAATRDKTVYPNRRKAASGKTNNCDCSGRERPVRIIKSFNNR